MKREPFPSSLSLALDPFTQRLELGTGQQVQLPGQARALLVQVADEGAVQEAGEPGMAPQRSARRRQRPQLLGAEVGRRVGGGVYRPAQVVVEDFDLGPAEAGEPGGEAGEGAGQRLDEETLEGGQPGPAEV